MLSVYKSLVYKSLVYKSLVYKSLVYKFFSTPYGICGRVMDSHQYDAQSEVDMEQGMWFEFKLSSVWC